MNQYYNFLIASRHRDDSAAGPVENPPVQPPVQPPVAYNLYISSAGNDANAGTSATSPLRTIASLQAKALAFGNGVKVKFLDETVYRERLDLTTLDNVLIDAGFSTLNAADIVAKNAGLWSRPDAAGQPNVWRINWATSGVMMQGVVMLANGVIPTQKANLSDVNQTPGTFHMAGSYQYVDQIQVSIHSADDPNTNSVVYEIMKRSWGVATGKNATTRNLIAGVATSNNGAAEFGEDNTVENSLFVDQHKHNVFAKSGTFRDCISRNAADFQPAAGPFVAFMPSPAGKSINWTRCLAIMPNWKETLVGGFYAHGATDAQKFDLFTMDGVIGYQVNSLGMPSAIGGTFRNNYALSTALDSPVSSMMTVERCLYEIRPGGIHTPTPANIGHKVVYKNVAAWSVTRGFRSWFNLTPGADLTLENCAIAGDGEGFLFDAYTVTGARLTLTKNVFAQKTSVNLGDGGTIYTGDYNIFYGNDFGWDNIRFYRNGVSYNNLADWQAAVNQELNSVYVTTAQRANLFLGSTATGDFRINPNAQVTAANGQVFTGTFPDGTPLTQAGAQQHYNHNTRQVVAGPPTDFPTPPVTHAQSLQFIKDPAAWNYYP